MKDFPVTTPEEVEKLMKAFYDHKKADGQFKLLTTPLGTGHYKASLTSSVDVIANGDTGADHSALIVEHLKLFNDAGVFVPTQKFRQSINMGLAMVAGEEGGTVTAPSP